MFNKIHHVAIIASNYEKTKDFYVNKLELEIINETIRKERNDILLNLKVGDIQLEIFGVDHPPRRVSNPEACGLRHLAFYVEDVDKTVEWLQQKGIICEPIRLDPITNKRMTFFKDPDDLPIEIHE